MKRHVLALLLLLVAVAHPVADQQHAFRLSSGATVVEDASTQDCPCLHATSVETVAPGLTPEIPPAAPHAVFHTTSFVPAPVVSGVPSRAPPAIG